MRRRDLLGHCIRSAALLAPVPGSALAVSVRQRQMRFTLQLTNPLGRELREQAVSLYVPMRRTGTQELNEVVVSMPHELMFDSLGQSIVTVRPASIAPFATRIVSVSSRLSLSSDPIDEPIRDASAWLNAERFVETEDASIQALGRNLKRDRPRETAAAIFDWVRLNIEYAGYVADDLGAREALRSRRGDCTEYAYLCAALARVNGIPARVVGGYVAEADSAPRAVEFHNWTQCHIDGAWRTVDAQRQQWWDGRDYIAFHVVVDSTSESVPLGSAHRFKVTAPLRVAM